MSMGRLLLLAWLLAAFGCSSGPAPERVLRLANWGGAGSDNAFDRLVQRIYRQFEREHPGVRIRVENIPDGYVPKMLLSFVARAAPDLVTLDASSAAVFLNNNLLSDLTPFIQRSRDFSLDDFYPNVVNIARRDGQLYAIPNDFTPMVVYYNKRLFDRVGVPYPKPGWTFDEFRRTAKALTIGGGSGKRPSQYGFSFANAMSNWIMWLWNNGGEVLSPDGRRASGYFDSPQNVQTVSFLRDLIQVDGSAPVLSQVAAMGVDPFANGDAAMTVSGHWSMIGYASAPLGPDGKPRITLADLGVASMPRKVGAPQTVMYESGFGISRDSPNKQLAWEFIKYFTSYRVQALYNSSGIAISARKDVSRERARDPLEAQFLPLVPGARAPQGSRTEGYEFVEKAGAAAMDSVLNNGADVASALRRAARRIDLEFAKK